jgi:hypothetical protein
MVLSDVLLALAGTLLVVVVIEIFKRLHDRKKDTRSIDIPP